MGAALDDLLDLFVRLVEIPSPSGHERAVADFILGYLRDGGLEPTEDDSAAATGAGSGNILVRCPAAGAARRSSWPRTWTPSRSSGPIKAVVEGGVVRSAGDTILGGDDKAACAVLLAVLADLAAAPPPCGFEAVFSTCEEVGLRGAKALDLRRLAARAGFVFDSTGPVGAVITRAPSQKMLTADFHGVAAHAGIAPEKGRSAIAAAAAAVAAMKLGRIDEQTTANIGLISGGSAVNVVPERCRIEGEVRSHDAGAPGRPDRRAWSTRCSLPPAWPASTSRSPCATPSRASRSPTTRCRCASPARPCASSASSRASARAAAAPTSTSTTPAGCRAST